jgi:hypothetical protein
MAHSDSLETCPLTSSTLQTAVGVLLRNHPASPERIWELLTNPVRLDWPGVKVVEAPARNVVVGDRLVFGPAPGLRLSWKVLSVAPLRTTRARCQSALRHEEPRDRRSVAHRRRQLSRDLHLKLQLPSRLEGTIYPSCLASRARQRPGQGAGAAEEGR